MPDNSIAHTWLQLEMTADQFDRVKRACALTGETYNRFLVRILEESVGVPATDAPPAPPVNKAAKSTDRRAEAFEEILSQLATLNGWTIDDSLYYDARETSRYNAEQIFCRLDDGRYLEGTHKGGKGVGSFDFSVHFTDFLTTAVIEAWRDAVEKS